MPGHSKGIGYRQGQSLKNVKSDHLWNAVLLGGQWFLLDACWGAGRVDMEEKSFVKRFEEPGVYNHVAGNQQEVLLRPAVSICCSSP